MIPPPTVTRKQLVDLLKQFDAQKIDGQQLADAVRAYLATSDLQMRKAMQSLVLGVEELQAEWPILDLPPEGRHNDLIGFLFATLPLSQRALNR